MKSIPSLLIIASLTINAALVATLVKRPPSSRDEVYRPPSAAVPDAAPTVHSANGAATPGAITIAATGDPASATSKTLWERIESRDPATFVANLRAAGFSLGAMRGAAYALLRDLQTAERTKAVESLPVEPYWKATPSSLASSDYAKEINRLWHERDRTMRRLFPEEQEAFVLRQQARFGPLAVEKLEKLATLDRDYGEMRMELTRSSSGLRMPWSSDQQAFLEQEKRKDVAAILSPQELEDYDFRVSPTATALQRQLANFDPTEQEFRDLFRLRAPLDEKMRAGGMAFANTPEAAALQQKVAAEIKSMLGEARYEDYTRATDAGVQSAASIARRLSLPANTANDVYQLQREMQDREAAIQRQQTQSPAQRDAQLAALAAEAQQKLSTLLTTRGADQYRLETGSRSLPILERTGTPRR